MAESTLNDQLLAVYDTKYAGSIERYRDKMRDGVASGDRVLLRYRPV